MQVSRYQTAGTPKIATQKVAHQDPLEDPVVETFAGEETQEEVSEDTPIKSDNNVEIDEEKVEVDEKGLDEVEIVGEVKSEESTNVKREGVSSGTSKNSKTKVKAKNKRDNSGCKLTSANETP